jgi:hypothetical protein
MPDAAYEEHQGYTSGVIHTLRIDHRKGHWSASLALTAEDPSCVSE